jgi:hypothetical protein
MYNQISTTHINLKFVHDMQFVTHDYIALNNLGTYMYNYYALMPNVKKYINDEQGYGFFKCN